MLLYIFNAVLCAAILTERVTAQSSESCAGLTTKLALPNTTVWLSQYVAAGTKLPLPDYDPTCTQTSQAVPVDICRVTLAVATTPRSGFSMEAWLPLNWTGRFLATGTGGISGCLQYADVAYGVSLGFATVGTNAGYNGTNGRGFFNNPDVIADFSFRATHNSVTLGKQIAKEFYGRNHTKSYYYGCSNAGRQGLKSAQDFPTDFDGIVAGAPAVAFNNLSTWSGHFFTLTGPPTAPTFVSPDMWAAVHQAVLLQCDQLDGLKDGILEDPSICKFSIQNLICNTTAGTASCPNELQAKTIDAVYQPLIGENNALVYPRIQPGSELASRFIYYNGKPFPYTTDWYQNAIYNNRSWDPQTLNAKDYTAAASKNPANVDSWETLDSFQNTGGKLIMWHGLADPIISSENSIRYYKYVSEKMKQSSAELDSFFRFFRISGLDHCGGGEGAWAIGQGLDATSGLEPDRHILMALVQWVEGNQAPESILGTRFVNGTLASGVQFSRKHCKYPLRNTYVSGDQTKPESWKCVA